jgi:hypothetical protein
MYDVSKYKCYAYEDKDNNNIPTCVAISTYAGKKVKGFAKLDPKDEFNWEAGRDLAIARCNAKIAKKRKARAAKKLAEAEEILAMAQAHYDDMVDYLANSTDALFEAEDHITELLKNM